MNASTLLAFASVVLTAALLIILFAAPIADRSRGHKPGKHRQGTPPVTDTPTEEPTP